MHGMEETAMLILVKFKVWILGPLIALFTVVTRYIDKRKQGKKITLWDFVQFWFLSSVVAVTILSIFQEFGYEIKTIQCLITYWIGISTEFIYTWAMDFTKSLLTKIKEKGEDKIEDL